MLDFATSVGAFNCSQFCDARSSAHRMWSDKLATSAQNMGPIEHTMATNLSRYDNTVVVGIASVVARGSN